MKVFLLFVLFLFLSSTQTYADVDVDVEVDRALRVRGGKKSSRESKSFTAESRKRGKRGKKGEKGKRGKNSDDCEDNVRALRRKKGKGTSSSGKSNSSSHSSSSKGRKKGKSSLCPTPSPTATPTSTPTATPTSMPTATPTSTPTATPTSTPTATPTSTPTATPTSMPTATPTSTPMATGCEPSSATYNINTGANPAVGGVCSGVPGIDLSYDCAFDNAGPIDIGPFTDTAPPCSLITAMTLTVYGACTGDVTFFLNGVPLTSGSATGLACSCQSIASDPNIPQTYVVMVNPAIQAAIVIGGPNVLSVSAANSLAGFQCFYGADIAVDYG